MIVFQKPFPGASSLRAVQDRLGALPLLRPGRQPHTLVEARHVWLMGRQWGVLFEVRRLMLEALGAPCCPFGWAASSELKVPTYSPGPGGRGCGG